MYKDIVYRLILLLSILPCINLPKHESQHECGRAEYDSGEGCCPVCSAGYRVRKHCTEMTSTTCEPCPPSTYSDQPSGLTSCLACTVCDYSAGLRVKKVCRSTSDTLCEPLEGHYCTDPIKDGCRGAVEHTMCSPGQYIKQNGSASSDTECGDCGNNTYSDGSFTSCRPHTQCDPLNLGVIREGTSSSDAECGRSGIAPGVVVAIVLVILAVIVGIVMFLLCWKRTPTPQQPVVFHALKTEL
ncbi:tumor necrosis factor receptor superfamily member 14-like isoform X4 [Alosa pseudoharengus]|uniref:tumor necrosis factor receptor superfamily member 14-like isoform X4 n=1 Tax=Alosa pseudoharengus TaxID=34774 RepID=UPI003F8CB50D